MAGSNSAAAKQAVNLLALDGGGIRGISELLILDEMMRRIQHDQQLAELPRPCDYFDLIGGTSTGGLVALMLGRLRMKTDEALRSYNSLAGAIFSLENKKWKTQDGLFKATTLESKVKDLVADRGLGERMLDPSTPSSKGKAFVCAMPAHNTAYPRLFRTYPVRANASANCEIWEAARATSAAPTYFKRIVICDEGGSSEEFIDGGVGCNNPAEQVLQEARDVFGNDRAIGCLVSIGTGHPGAIGLARPDAFQKVLPTKLIGVVSKTATDCEKLADSLAKRFQDHEKLFYRFNVEHGAEGVSLEEWKKLGEMTGHTKAYLRKTQVTKMIDEVVELLCRSAVTERTLGSLYGVSPFALKEPSTSYTYPNYLTSFRLASSFVRRQDLSIKIKDGFARTSNNAQETIVLVLLGMGGSGKTQLALDFCKHEQAEGHYQAIFWIDATNPETVAHSFADVSKEIYGAEQGFQNEDELLASVIRTMKGWNTPWLMVFDNYDHPSSFDEAKRTMWEYWPSTKYGSVLFTSRHGSSKLLGKCVEVKGMELHEGVDLLLRRSGKDRDAEDLAENLKQAEHIVQILGYLALAIDQAAAFICVNGLDLQDYPQLYEDMKEEILREVPDAALWEYRKSYGDSAMETARSVFTTWELSFNSIKGQANEKQRKGHFLTLSSFLDRMDISEGLFRKHFESEEHPADWMATFTPSGKWNRLSFWRLLVELKNLALLDDIERRVNDHVNGSVFSLHPLIRDWAQLRSNLLRPDYVKQAVRLVTCSLPVPDTSSYPSFTLQERNVLLQHVDAVSNNCKTVLDETDWPGAGFTADFGYRCGAFYAMSNRHKDAETIWRRILMHTSNDLDEAIVAKRVRFQIRLAWCLFSQSQHSESKQVRIQAWDLSQKYLGDESSEKWLAATNMALTHMKDASFANAEALLLKGLEMQKQLMGMAHLDTLATLQNLSRVYKRVQRLTEAEHYGRLAVTELIPLQGVDSRQVIHARVDLAETYFMLNRYADAEELLRDCSTRAETLLGPCNPLTISTILTLGKVYRSQKRYPEANSILWEKLVPTIEQTFGFENARYMETVVEVAITWQQQGDVDKALDLLRGQVARYDAITTVDNWDGILKTRSFLMRLYSQRKNYTDGEALSIETLAKHKALRAPTDLRDFLWFSYFFYASQSPAKDARMEESLDQAIAETIDRLGGHNLSLVQFLKLALSGYSHLGRDEKADRYSLTMLMLWEDAGGPRYHERQVDNELAVDASGVAIPVSLLYDPPT